MLSPLDYAEAAVIADAAAEGLDARLAPIMLQPQTLLEVNCRSGNMWRRLAARYSHARLIATDESAEMLAHTRAQSMSLAEWIVAPPTQLPVAEASIDLCVANLVLPWCQHEAALHTWAQRVRPGGVLALTTLGLDTCCELLGLDIPLPFAREDMHNTGDALVAAGFTYPVLDVEYITLTYRDLAKLYHELCATAMLLPTRETQQRLENLTQQDGVYALTMEIIYAHAFRRENTTGEVRVPLSDILRRG